MKANSIENTNAMFPGGYLISKGVTGKN